MRPRLYVDTVKGNNVPTGRNTVKAAVNDGFQPHEVALAIEITAHHAV